MPSNVLVLWCGAEVEAPPTDSPQPVGEEQGERRSPPLYRRWRAPTVICLSNAPRQRIPDAAFGLIRATRAPGDRPGAALPAPRTGPGRANRTGSGAARAGPARAGDPGKIGRAHV